MNYTVLMSEKEWNRTHSDFKTVINGVRFILTFIIGKGSCLVPVEFRDEVIS